MRVDIGGGLAPREGHVNLDPVHGEGKWRRPVQAGIPAENATVEAAYASHVLEHIHAGDERIFVMNEVHRVLVPGGLFEIRVPLFPSWQAVADPTHVSFWVAESFDYFCGKIAQADYGIRWWEKASFGVNGGWEGVCVLRKPR